jgi:hypothetical protein
LCANCVGETALTDEIMGDALSKFTTPACRSSTVLVHCSTGFLGNQGAKALADFGFRHVHAMGPEGTSGLLDWQNLGYEVELEDTFVEVTPGCEGIFPTDSPTAALSAAASMPHIASVLVTFLAILVGCSILVDVATFVTLLLRPS